MVAHMGKAIKITALHAEARTEALVHVKAVVRMMQKGK